MNEQVSEVPRFVQISVSVDGESPPYTAALDENGHVWWYREWETRTLSNGRPVTLSTGWVPYEHRLSEAREDEE